MQELFETYTQLLNEDTVQQLMQDQQYKGLSIEQLMEIWSFSGDWRSKKPTMGMCKMQLQFDNQDELSRFIERFSQEEENGKWLSANEKRTTVRNTSTGIGSKSFTFPIAKSWQPAIMKMLKPMWPYSVDGVGFGKGPDGKLAFIVKSSDESVLATAWQVAKSVEAAGTDQNFKDQFQALVDAKLQRMPELGGAAKLAVFIDKANEYYSNATGQPIFLYGQQPISSISSLKNPDELTSALVEQPIGDEAQKNELTLIGQFESLKQAYKIKHGEMDANAKEQFNKICVPIGIASPSDEMTSLVKLVQNDIANGQYPNVDAALSSMAEEKLGIALANMQFQAQSTIDSNNYNAVRRGRGEADVPADSEVVAIGNFSGIKQLLSEYGFMSVAKNNQASVDARKASYEWTAEPQGDASASNDVARRRMKLFEDISHMPNPPKIYKYGHWICAVCTTKEHAYFWTRTRPKVYVSGPKAGEIIAYANLRTDELDQLVSNGTLTREAADMYKAVRDTPFISGYNNAPKLVETVDGNPTEVQYKFVADGLRLPIRGKSSDHTTDNHPAEVYWCTSGALNISNNCHSWDDTKMPDGNSFYNNYNLQDRSTKARNPYWVIMDTSNGVLYQHSRYVQSSGSAPSDCCLAENDLETDLNGKDIGKQSDGFRMAALFLTDKHYAQMMGDIRNDNEMSRLMQLKDQAETTNDGYCIATSQEKLDALMPLFSAVDGYHKLRLKGRTWTAAFRSQNIPYLTDIDFDGVQNANDMFMDATIAPTLRITGMDTVKTCRYMFDGAKNANIIKGIDTKSSATCECMFRNVQTQHNTNLYIDGTLSLRSCENINAMFKNSPVVSIRIEHTGKVTNATNFFYGCNRLESFPDARFEKCKGQTTFLGIDSRRVANDPMHFAMKVRTPFKHNRKQAQKWINDMKSFYLPNTDVTVVKKNGKSLVAFKSTDPLYVEMMLKALHADYQSSEWKYDGIIIDGPTDGTNMFSIERIDWDPIVGNTYESGSVFALPCNIFDFGTLTSGNGMFYGVNLDNVNEFVGADNITDASGIFSNAVVGSLPSIQFKNATQAVAPLKHVTSLNSLPQMSFSYKCTTNFSSNGSSVASLFGNCDSNDLEKISKRLGLSRVYSLMDGIQNDIDIDRAKYFQQALQVDEHGFAEVSDEMLRQLVISNFFGNLANRDTIKTLKLPADAQKHFNVSDKLIKWLPTLDMSNVTTCESMFASCDIGDGVDIKMVNTSNIKTCQNMFNGTMFNGDISFIKQILEFENCSDYSYFMRYANINILANPEMLSTIKFGSKVENVEHAFEQVSAQQPLKVEEVVIENPRCNCVGMFYSTSIGSSNGSLTVKAENARSILYNSVIYASRISFPMSKVCESAMSHAKFCSTIKLIDMPIAVNADYLMFETKMNYTTDIFPAIGKVNAPELKSATKMFNNSFVKGICFLNIPHISDADFNSTSMFVGELAAVYGPNGEYLASVVKAANDLHAAAQAAIQAQAAPAA